MKLKVIFKYIKYKVLKYIKPLYYSPLKNRKPNQVSQNKGGR